MNGEFAIALHALVYLRHKATTLRSEALAQNVCTNPARIRKVMAKLKKAGLVDTREGAGGGYSLADPHRDISLRQVADALQQPIVYANWKSGDPNMDCLVAAGMAKVVDDLCAQLDDLCRTHLEATTVSDIERRLFASRP